MKRFLLLSLPLLLFYGTTNGQGLDPLRVEIGLSVHTALGSDFSTGSGIYLEPKYVLNDQWTFGMRFERSFLNGNEIEVGGSSFDLSTSHLQGNMVFAEYHLPGGAGVTPFVGLATGLFLRKKVGLAVDIGGVDLGELDNAITNAGFAPRVGIRSGRFRILGTFNFTGRHIANYGGINIGYEIGKKRK